MDLRPGWVCWRAVQWAVLRAGRSADWKEQKAQRLAALTGKRWAAQRAARKVPERVAPTAVLLADWRGV
jgi:hypothetical protein